MFGKSYLELLQSLLEFDFKFLCPWKDGSNNSKLSKLFLACFVSPLTMALTMSTFIYYSGTISLLEVSENIAFAIAFGRCIGNSVLVKKFYFEYKRLVDKLIDDRRTLSSDPNELVLTDSYCKTEFGLNVLFHLRSYCIVLLFLFAFVYFSTNVYQLPFNCYVVFIPPDGFMFAYELNYLIMSVAMTSTMLVYASFAFIPFLLMNHSCWCIDMALITGQELNESLQPNEDISDTERFGQIKENLKKFAQRCEKFVDWQKEAQSFLFWYFNLEFQVQAFILCLSVYVLSSTFSGAVLMLFFCYAVQIFVLCWMGTRVTSRLEELSFEVGKNWYSMPHSQRKALQMILHWTQNMTGFSGMFSHVSLETCKAIFEAAYSFYAFLRSTNNN